MDTIESLTAKIESLTAKNAGLELELGILKTTTLLPQEHNIDPDIAPLLAHSERAQAALRGGESPETVAARLAAEAPAKFRAKKPSDGVALKERFEALHREAAERRLDAVAELRQKLGMTR